MHEMTQVIILASYFHREHQKFVPCRLLHLLVVRGVYESAALLPAISIAQRSVEELPACALLAEYLPGPAQSAAELGRTGGALGDNPGGDPRGGDASGLAPCGGAAAQAGPHCNGAPAAGAKDFKPLLNPVAWGMPASVAAGLLEDRYRAVCPRTDFTALVAAARGQAAEQRIVRSRHARMHVAGVPEAGVVSFVPCSADRAAGSPQARSHALLPRAC